MAGTYAAVAVKISTLELEEERRTNPTEKIAVKSAMRPRIKPIEWTLARTVMATVGSRQATTVVMIDVTRTIHELEYSMKLLVMQYSDSLLVLLSLVALLLAEGTSDRLPTLDAFESCL